jgi:hypothetical protein
MMDNSTKQAIKQAFLQGELKVLSVDNDTNQVDYQVISDVMKHHTPHKRILRVELDNGQFVIATQDHSLFTIEEGKIKAIETDQFSVGDTLAIVEDGQVKGCLITNISQEDDCEHTYDLCVPRNENFVLANGILAHNSYSIGGISLDLDRSSKYESLKSTAESMWSQSVEAKARTTKFMRGLRQPKYGVGIRSSFGPAVGRGVLSPRNFL